MKIINLHISMKCCIELLFFCSCSLLFLFRFISRSFFIIYFFFLFFIQAQSMNIKILLLDAYIYFLTPIITFLRKKYEHWNTCTLYSEQCAVRNIHRIRFLLKTLKYLVASSDSLPPLSLTPSCTLSTLVHFNVFSDSWLIAMFATKTEMNNRKTLIEKQKQWNYKILFWESFFFSVFHSSLMYTKKNGKMHFSKKEDFLLWPMFVCCWKV